MGLTSAVNSGINMRRTITIAALSLFIGLQSAFAAPGGGSFEPTVKPSNDAALEADFAQGEYLIKSEKFAEAIPYLERVIAKKADHADALNYLGYANRKLGKNDVSLGFYQRALKADPKHKGANEYLGELYLQMKDLPKAEAQLAILKELCPTGCEEREDLEADIAEYKKAAKP